MASILCNNRSGDGAGLLTEVPWQLFAQSCPELESALASNRPVGVGMFFLDQGADRRAAAKVLVEKQVRRSTTRHSDVLSS